MPSVGFAAPWPVPEGSAAMLASSGGAVPRRLEALPTRPAEAVGRRSAGWSSSRLQNATFQMCSGGVTDRAVLKVVACAQPFNGAAGRAQRSLAPERLGCIEKMNTGSHSRASRCNGCLLFTLHVLEGGQGFLGFVQQSGELARLCPMPGNGSLSSPRRAFLVGQASPVGSKLR